MAPARRPVVDRVSRTQYGAEYSMAMKILGLILSLGTGNLKKTETLTRVFHLKNISIDGTAQLRPPFLAEREREISA